MIRGPPRPTLFPSTTLFRSKLGMDLISPGSRVIDVGSNVGVYALPWAASKADVTVHCFEPNPAVRSRLARNAALNRLTAGQDRKSTRPHSSHTLISYALFCL